MCPLQLSHYLDVVELDLLRSIETRSDDFFTALTTLQELRHVVAVANNDITNLRYALLSHAAVEAFAGVLNTRPLHTPLYSRRMARLKECMSSKALRLLARRRRQAAQALVLKQAELIAGVPKARDWIKKLLRQNDYSGRPSTLSPVSSPAESLTHTHTHKCQQVL